MKKAIKRFWGIGLIVIILSSFFMAVPAAPASGGIYAWAADTTQPSVANGLLSPIKANTFGYTDITSTADGANIYMTACDTASTNYLYKSTNGGVSWTKPAGGTAASPFTAALPNTSGLNQWTYVAVAPDDPNTIAVVSYAVTTGVGNTIYLSTNGGATFSSLGTPGATLTVNDLAVSSISGPYRYIAVAATDNSTTGYLYSWTVGAAAPAWSNKASTLGGVTVGAVAFSPAFASDATLLFVSADATDVKLHAYSYNTLVYDANVDSSFPRVIYHGTPTLNRASITLDPTFYMGDSAAQIGFIGTSITDGTEHGGVSRISTYTVASGVYSLTKIMADTGIGYVAWDGTNLVAAPYIPINIAADAGITIYRSADALSSTSPTFTPSSSSKAPGSGYEAKLLWNAGSLLAISRGYNAAVAKSADLGKSFNGIALCNTSWTVISGAWISTDNSVMYIAVNDGIDTLIWRYKASAWQRVMIMAADASGS
ncbi:MAG TPA: hypothetical protein VMB24_06370, partial [Dehalococcoidales bacterium]|nr:hypothetical protein [Dehalococcoidales bacterium]